MKKSLWIGFLLLACISVSAQDTKDTLESWMSKFYKLTNPVISDNGKWAAVRKRYNLNQDTLLIINTNNRSSNQLVGLPLAATTGFLTVQSNFPAKVLNKGAEAELNVNLIRKKDLRWSVAANLTVPRTKLLEFDNIESTSYATTYEVGRSMNIKKVYELKGVNPDTGVYEFSDLNGDGKIDLNDRTKVVDIGMKFFGGLSSQINYKNWSFAFLIQGVKQRQYSLDYSISLLGIMSNVPSYMLDYWTPENRDARYQRPGTGTNSDVTRAHSLYQSSDAVIVDASFIRLNNVQLSYKIPLKEGLIRDLTLQAQAQNLFTITGYKGLDPEVAGFYLPSIKSYSLNRAGKNGNSTFFILRIAFSLLGFQFKKGRIISKKSNNLIVIIKITLADFN